MKAIAYIRVSGKGQVEGDGHDRQSDSINTFCLAQGLGAPLVLFFEAAVSGTVDAMDRPQFGLMIETVESRAADGPWCIVVERLDRLARDLMVSEFLLAECRKRNIPVYASDQGSLIDMASDGVDPTRVLLRQILGAVAQWEKSALVMKLRKARDRKRALTGRCEGPVPYGATPEEKKVVDYLDKCLAAGMSPKQASRFANGMGYKSPTGKPWTRGMVYQLMERRKANNAKSGGAMK
jgi:DNA invertase Pin-like site-specific DNA recombinase